MATIDVAVSTDLAPQQAWKLASDLHRFDEWLTIFGGWRSEVPSKIEPGTCVSSCIKVKGFRNIIGWRVTRFDEPKLIELSGAGRGGVRISLTIEVQDKGPGSTFRVVAERRAACSTPGSDGSSPGFCSPRSASRWATSPRCASPIRGSWRGIRSAPRRYRYRAPARGTAR